MKRTLEIIETTLPIATVKQLTRIQLRQEVRPYSESGRRDVYCMCERRRAISIICYRRWSSLIVDLLERAPTKPQEQRFFLVTQSSVFGFQSCSNTSAHMALRKQRSQSLTYSTAVGHAESAISNHTQ